MHDGCGRVLPRHSWVEGHLSSVSPNRPCYSSPQDAAAKLGSACRGNAGGGVVRPDVVPCLASGGCRLLARANRRLGRRWGRHWGWMTGFSHRWSTGHRAPSVERTSRSANRPRGFLHPCPVHTNSAERPDISHLRVQSQQHSWLAPRRAIIYHTNHGASVACGGMNVSRRPASQHPRN